MVLPYLKGLVIIKCGFFYLVCGSIVYSVFVVIIFVDLVKVLNTCPFSVKQSLNNILPVQCSPV
jgi:hypothetical protein